MKKIATDAMSLIAKHSLGILDTMNSGVYISDREGMTLFVNKAYEKLTGLRGQDLFGKNVRDLKQAGVFDIVLNPVVVRTRKTASTVQELRKKRVFLQAIPLFSGKDVDLVVTIVRDITSITRLNEQVSRQDKIIKDYHERMSFISEETRKGPESDMLQSESMQKLLSRLRPIAETDASVLIIGETGVGKDVLAKWVHNISPRRDKIFLKVDCGSISENLIESELFGYVAGAFSGAADKGKPGYFEVADGGTIMLDEIGELPLPMQTRFLRVLQDNEIMRVGDTLPRKVDVRIIAATNVNLEEAVQNGTFRKDLYYRLNVAQLRVPPLRERQADIRAFLDFFLAQFSARYRHSPVFAEETIRELEEYPWPGNIRELQNLVQSFVVNHEIKVIGPEDLPPHIHSSDKNQPVYTCTLPNQGIALQELIANIETDLLESTLMRLGSVNKTASFFRVNRSTIFRKLNRK